MKEPVKLASGYGFKAKGLDPEAVADSLEELRKSVGLTPPNLVEAARDEEHPAHTAFEWDDTEAAHEFRLCQARSLIKAVVVMTDGESEPVYYHVEVEENRTYEHRDVIVRRVDLLAAAREDLLRVLKYAERSLRQLETAAARHQDKKELAKAARIKKPLKQALAEAGA